MSHTAKNGYVNISVRFTEAEYQELLRLQLVRSSEVGQVVALNAYIKDKALASQ